MKKIIALALILTPFAVFGATSLMNVTPIEWHEAVAQIKTQDSSDILIYRVEDRGNTCYVSYMNGFTNGSTLSMSCVNQVK